MTQNDKPTEAKEESKKPQDNTGVMMTGHIKISDPETGEVIVDKRNAIHYENMSQALANSLATRARDSYTRLHWAMVVLAWTQQV